MKTLPVAVCIVEHDGKFALIKFKRNYLAGLWGLPGGKLDADEHVPEAAVREVHEELGINTALKRSLATVDEIAIDKDGSATRFVLFICLMKPIGEVTAASRDLPEGTIQWFLRDEIESMKDQMVPSDYRIFTELTDSQEPALYKSKQEFKDGKLALSYFEKVG